MTLGITYDDTDNLGRVRLAFSGYSTNADYATVERSLDQITWTLVRGGDRTALTAGVGHLDDYEYQAGALNYYRVTAIDNAAVAATAGTAAFAVNASVTPTLPAGLTAGDVMLLHATIRNSGTGTVNVPAGWTAVTNTGNMLLARRTWQSGDVAPTVTFAGGAANEDTIAVIVKLTNTDPVPYAAPATQLNGSAQDVLSPGGAVPAGGIAIRYAWKQDDATGIGATGYTSLVTLSTVTGNDASQCLLTKLITVTGAEPSATILWSGGATAISRAGFISFRQLPFTDQESGSITPVMATWRLKNPSRPALNTKIEVVALKGVSRTTRTGTFDVLGRNLPVAVTDVAGSRKFTLQLDVTGYALRDDMDNRLAVGEPMFLQAPSALGPVPNLYFVCTGDISWDEDAELSQSFTFTLSCIEVAKPGATVYGDTYIWNDVVTSYATWTAVLAAVSTWSNLIDKISTSTVIVP